MSNQPPYHDDTPTVESSVGTYPPPQMPPPQMPPPQVPPYMAPPAPGGSGGLAIAGLVLALLSMTCLIMGIGLILFRHAAGLAALVLFCGLPLGVVGIVLAAVGRSSAARTRGSGTAGLILSTLAVVLTALFLLSGLAAARAGVGPGRLRPPRPRFQPQGSGAPVLVRMHVPYGPSR